MHDSKSFFPRTTDRTTDSKTEIEKYIEDVPDDQKNSFKKQLEELFQQGDPNKGGLDPCQRAFGGTNNVGESLND